ncbi:MAG: hypothetical protein ABUS79_13740 [Pseudomonadota bacterium]
MNRHTAEVTRSSQLRGRWPGWLRHGAFALALCVPAAASAASDDEQASEKPASLTHNEANPATSSTAREPSGWTTTDGDGRAVGSDSAQSNYQPASTPGRPESADHAHAQSSYQLGAGHQD